MFQQDLDSYKNIYFERKSGASPGETFFILFLKNLNLRAGRFLLSLLALPIFPGGGERYPNFPDYKDIRIRKFEKEDSNYSSLIKTI